MPYCWYIYSWQSRNTLKYTHCIWITNFNRVKKESLFCLTMPLEQDSTYHSLWWTSCGPLIGTENSPNCKCFRHAGLIHHVGGSKHSQQCALSPEIRPAPLILDSTWHLLWPQLHHGLWPIVTILRPNVANLLTTEGWRKCGWGKWMMIWRKHWKWFWSQAGFDRKHLAIIMVADHLRSFPLGGRKRS